MNIFDKFCDLVIEYVDTLVEDEYDLCELELEGDEVARFSVEQENVVLGYVTVDFEWNVHVSV